MEAREYCGKTKEVEVDYYPSTREQSTVMEAVIHAPKVKGESYLQIYNLREANVDKPICKFNQQPREDSSY